jgi:hypothetical protein
MKEKGEKRRERVDGNNEREREKESGRVVDNRKKKRGRSTNREKRNKIHKMTYGFGAGRLEIFFDGAQNCF